jgi:hypothetical protein
MGQQTVGDWRSRLSLVGLTICAPGAAHEYASLYIDMTATYRRLE